MQFQHLIETELSHNLFQDILAMHQDIIAMVRNDPRVIGEPEMIPDDEHGTKWLIHLRGGQTIWVAAGTFDMAISQGWHYQASPTPLPLSDSPSVKDIEKWIRKRYPDINNWSIEDNIVLYGLVQAGKTELLLSMIWISQYVYEVPCVLVLANMAASYNQVLQKNAIEFNNMLREEFGEGALAFRIKPIGFRKRDVHFAVEDHTFLHVAMGNPAQLKRLIATKRGQFILFCDEADVHVKACDDDVDDTRTGPLIKQLQDMALGSVKITATPFALWNQVGAIQKTLIMSKPQKYRGLSETDWVFSSDTDAKDVRNGNVRKTVDMLDEMVMVQRPRVEGSGYKYMTILINGPVTIAGQDALALSIAKLRPKFNVYVMNSGGKNPIRKATANRLVDIGRQTIASLYSHFETDESNDFNIHIIVACLTAARAISFRPTSRRDGTGGLHGMIFFPSVKCHAAQLIQFMRVWGNYDEDYPKIRVRTTQIAFNKLQSEITHNLKEFAEITSKIGLSREQIEGVYVIDIGLHDRRTVDDTIIHDRSSMLKREFETQNEMREFLAGDFDRFVILTNEELIQIPANMVPRFSPNMKGNSHDACIVRPQIMDIIPANVPRNSVQICWNDARYEKLHHIPSRMTASGEYNSKVVVGLSSTCDMINVVVWRDDFRDLLVSDLREDTAYLFRVTKGGWRYFTRKEKRRIGKLSHEPSE